MFTGTAALVLLLLAMVLALGTVGARRAARNAARQSLEQSADLVAQLLAGRGRSLGGGARVFVQGPYFRTLVAERRRDDILDQTFEAAEQLEASWVFITDDNGNLIAKSDEPSAFGEPMARVPLVSGALRGQVTTGFGGSGDSVLFQATAVPIAAPGGMPFGVLVATRVLDSLAAADIALATNQAVLFFVLDAEGRKRMAATSLASDTALRRAVVQAVSPTAPAAGRAHQEVEFDGRTWMLHRSTLATAGGTPVGGYVVLRLADDALVSLEPVRRSLLLAAILGLLGALIAARLTSRAVVHPVAAMTQLVRHVVEQGGAPANPLGSTPTGALYGSAELSALADAVDSLVVESNDQDTVRALLAAHPMIGAELTMKPRATTARTLAFRPTASRATAWAPGMLFAQRYRLDEELGRGELGISFRARDTARGQVVALRLLPTEPSAAEGTAASPRGDMVAPPRPAVVHRHLVQTLHVGEADGVRFVSVEFVDGLSLADLLQLRGALDTCAVAAIARAMLRGVAALHAHDITHANITTRSVLLSRAGVVKLGDYGITRRARRQAREAAGSDTAPAITGGRVGAPEYMAPELLIGGMPSAKADLYSIGVVLHECLIGTTPFGSRSPIEVLGSKLGSLTPRAAASMASEHEPVSESRRSERSPLPVRTPGAAPRPSELLSLVQYMIHPDPDRRLGVATEALAAWVRVGHLSGVLR